MPVIPEAPISVVASELSNNLSIFLGVSTAAAIAAIIHYASPKRLTGILIIAMAELKKTSSDAFEAGRLSASEIEKLRLLKHKVSAIQAKTLHDSRSYLKTICGFFKGRTFTVLLCIWEVQALETDVKIQLLMPQPSPGAADGAMNNAQTIVSGGNTHQKNTQQPPPPPPQQQQQQPAPQKHSWPPQRPPYDQPYREGPYSRQPPPPSNNTSGSNAAYMPSHPKAAMFPSPPPARPIPRLRELCPPPPRDNRERGQRDRDREQRERKQERAHAIQDDISRAHIFAEDPLRWPQLHIQAPRTQQNAIF
ncbi:hypothetical protein B0H19DRAFT_1251879 [Mycena capillaripes]|nr:hypothetical protein B0H19DRAFT_1251879 [Mycena capillaripes]